MLDRPPPRSQTFRIAVRKFPAFETAIAAQWQAFEAQAHTGLTPDFVPYDLHDLEHALFTSGGMKNDAWDVAFVATDWIGAMQAQSCATDLAPLIEKNPPQDYPQGWSPSLLRLQSIGDQVLGVPYHDGPECLIYRRDLFEDPANIARYQAEFNKPLAPPATWAEFHQQAGFFQAPSRGLYGTAFAAFPDGHNSVYDFLLQLWSRAGELFTPAGTCQFETAQAEAAIDFYRDILQDEQATHPACRQLDSVAAGMRFAAGEVALMINWFGFAAMAHTSPNSTVRGRVDIASIPAAEGSSSVSLNVYWLLSIPVGSPHQEIAWRFLRHTLTPAMDKLTTISGAIGCRLSTWTEEDVNSSIPFYHRLEELHRDAREIPQRADWPLIASTIDTLITKAITTDIPTRELLREAQDRHA